MTDKRKNKPTFDNKLPYARHITSSHFSVESGRSSREAIAENLPDSGKIKNPCDMSLMAFDIRLTTYMSNSLVSFLFNQHAAKDSFANI